VQMSVAEFVTTRWKAEHSASCIGGREPEIGLDGGPTAVATRSGAALAIPASSWQQASGNRLLGRRASFGFHIECYLDATSAAVGFSIQC